MRCPQCTERNSVAARKCEFCGTKFKRKPLPLGLKLGAAGVVVAITVAVGASLVVPKFVNTEQNLARVAKKVAAGPRSVEDANRSKTEFSTAVRSYLKDNGNAKSNELTDGLQKLLPSNTYEVHIAELPRGLRVIEIDTVLQATDYLVMQSPSGTKVFDLAGFEVFDDGHVLNDTAGPVLALVGHSGGQPPHKPIVKTYALMPDSISDSTAKLVPPIKGEGSAKFAADGQDIQLELAVKGPGKNAPAEYNYGLLHWKDAKYGADFSTKTAKLVRQHYKDVQVAATPASVADHPASPPPASAAAAPAVAVATGSTSERIAAAASPLLANAISHARANATRSKPAKIVVRGLKDGASENNLISQLPPAAVGSHGGPAPAIAPSVVPAQAKPLTAPDRHASQHGTDSGKTASASGSDTTNAADKHSKKHHQDETASGSSHKHGVGVISCAGGATLRTAAEKGAASLGGLATGTQLQIIGQSKNKDWYKVRADGKEGYIYASLVDTTGKMAANPESNSTSAGGSHKHHEHHHHQVLVADSTQTQSTSHADATTGSHSGSHHHHHQDHAQSSAPIEAPALVP